MPYNVPMRRLPLEGSFNTRDLGGYPCKGGTTSWRAFLRSDSPFALTGADIDALAAYGVATAVDLRSEEEQLRKPSPLASAPGFDAYQVSMSDHMHAQRFEGDLPGSMAGLYISMLDNNPTAFKQVFGIFAAAAKTTLFHCAIGKDRTGVVAMLLLKLAGVADGDTAADYAVSDIYISALFPPEFIKEHQIPEYVVKSKPESMLRVLAHLSERYGGAAQYLLQAGVSQQQLDSILAKLVTPL